MELCPPPPPPPSPRECPITLAAEKGFFELAQLLVARNANIECRTKKGCTPFFLACREGYIDIAVMLAKHGADTEVRGHTLGTSSNIPCIIIHVYYMYMYCMPEKS